MIEFRGSSANEKEILRDIPELYRKIDQARKSIGDYEKNIVAQEANKVTLSNLIVEEKERAASNKRPRYDVPSLEENKARCDKDIELFKKKIEEEKATIKRFEEIIVVLQKDLEKPKEIVLDMRKTPQFLHTDK